MPTATEPAIRKVRIADDKDASGLYGLSQIFVRTGALRDRNLASFTATTRDFVVAEIDGEIVGCIGLRRVADAPGSSVLYNFCIHPERQGAGLGALLLAGVVDRAGELGASKIYSATISGDGWFERHGFSRIRPENAPASWVAQLDPTRGSSLYLRSLTAG